MATPSPTADDVLWADWLLWIWFPSTLMNRIQDTKSVGYDTTSEYGILWI
jgi:hypothetical protein